MERDMKWSIIASGVVFGIVFGIIVAAMIAVIERAF